MRSLESHIEVTFGSLLSDVYDIHIIKRQDQRTTGSISLQGRAPSIVCRNIYIYIYIYTHTHVYIYVVCIYIYIYTYTYIVYIVYVVYIDEVKGGQESRWTCES